MTTQGKSRSSIAIPIFNLHSIYRHFVKEAKRGQASDTLEQRLAPAGNIYRLNALDAEYLKHHEDLQAQFLELAETKHSGTLDAMPWPGQEAIGEEPADLLERRRAKLLYCLRTAKVTSPELEEGDEATDAAKAIGLSFREFFTLSIAERKSATFKQRFLGMVIMITQIVGPLMVFINNWFSDTNYLRNRFAAVSSQNGFADQLKAMDWLDILNMRSSKEFGVSVLGSLFLIIFIEVVRAYVKDEAENSSRFSRLPVDAFWEYGGQVANMCATVFVVAAMPLVFWSEMHPKDIIFDALTLLFIFKIDDMSGDVVGATLGMDSGSFQRMASWNLALLSQCPVVLSDVTEPNATDATKIWRIHLGEDGPLGQDGRRIMTRLEKMESDETSPLKPVAEDSGSNIGEAWKKGFYSYHVSPGIWRRLPGRWSNQPVWHMIEAALLVCEIVFPVMFFLCYKSPAPKV